MARHGAASRERDEDAGTTTNSKTRRVLRGFRVAHVFALEQTDGDTATPPAGPELLDGEAPAGVWDALADQVRAAGSTLARAEIPSGANGTTNDAPDRHRRRPPCPRL